MWRIDSCKYLYQNLINKYVLLLYFKFFSYTYTYIGPTGKETASVMDSDDIIRIRNLI